MNQIEPPLTEDWKGARRRSLNFKYYQCWRCSCLIHPQQLVFRIPATSEDPQTVYYFHLNCFNCLICQCPLRKGQLFGLVPDTGSIYCHQHYPPMIQDGRINQNQVSEILGNSNTTDNNLGSRMEASQDDSNEKVARKQRKKPLKYSNSNEGSHNRLEDHLESSMNHQKSVHQNSVVFEENSKRIRTSFQKFQLTLLRKCFRQTHKPNSWELARLIERTGLSKRVLQIWFQNQRSKWSRYVLARPKSGPLTAEPCGMVEELFSVDFVETLI